MFEDRDVVAGVWDLTSASIASFISLTVMRVLGFNRSGELTTQQFVEFFLLIMGAILVANLLANFERFGLFAMVILVSSYFFGERVVWTLSSEQALANPEIQKLILVFAGFVLVGGAVLAFAIPAVILPQEDP